MAPDARSTTYLLAALCLTPLSARADEIPARPITVFVASKIHTMDPGWPSATAVAVQDERILSVGSLEDVKLYLGAKPFAIDESLRDKVLMPGFIESHGHPLLGSFLLSLPVLTHLPTPRAYGPDFSGVKNIQEATAKLKEYLAAAKDPNEYLIVWGYDVVAMGRHLTRDDLDAVAKDQPLLIWDASEHFVYANSAAMKKRGVTKEAARVNGVGIGPDGEPNGQFLGTTAAAYFMAPVAQRILQPNVALANFKSLADLSRKNGITTTSEFIFGKTDLVLEQRIFDGFFNNRAGVLRCVAVADGVSVTLAKKENAIEFVRGLERLSTDRLLFRGVKFFADDAFLSLSMQVQNPGYSDARQGIWIVRPGREMVDQWRPWWEAGFQIHVHTNGNAANQATLDALDVLQALKPRVAHRFTFQHFGISTPDQVRRLKDLGGLASLNPYYLYHRAELNAPLVGAERSYTAARFKTLADAGVPTALHSDTPVGPPRPLEWIWIAVNRFGLSGQVRGSAERVSPQQAFRMITRDAAYTLGVEDKIGSIEPGKLADFTVLDEDPLAVPVERIRDVKVWGTVLGGRLLPAADIRP